MHKKSTNIFAVMLSLSSLMASSMTGVVAAVASGSTVAFTALNGTTQPATFVAEDVTAGVASEKFYAQGPNSPLTYLSKDTSAPFDQQLTNLTPGNWTLQIREYDANGTEIARPQATFTVPGIPPATCIPVASVVTTGGGRQVAVSTSDGLKAALADARAGDTITLANGSYSSSQQFGQYYASFGLARSGTSNAPITVQGSANAVIDGDGTGGRYGFELYGTSYVVLKGFTVTSASKGIVLDGSSNNTIQGVTVSNIGAEGIHFRAMSRNNLLTTSMVRDTGMDKPNFGEGVYIGSAGDNNWKVFSCNQPDTSDANQIVNNTVLRARAESIDIKEGTTGGLVQGNTFTGDQTVTPAAPAGENSGDSWMDVKGNNYQILSNTGQNSLNHGYEVHAPVPAWYGENNVTPVPWGSNNIFSNNVANVNNTAATANPNYTGGYGFNVVGGTANLVKCNNIVTGATLGYSNVTCTQ